MSLALNSLTVSWVSESASKSLRGLSKQHILIPYPFLVCLSRIEATIVFIGFFSILTGFFSHFLPLFSDLLRCTEEPNVSIPTLANLLLERTQNPNWIVVFKSLVTIHNLMCYGNEVCVCGGGGGKSLNCKTRLAKMAPKKYAVL